MNKNQIIKLLKDKLYEKMGPDASNINIEYKNGHILLSGIVESLSEKTYTEEIIKKINKQSVIENKITICTDGEISDSNIYNQIEKIIANKNYNHSIEKVHSKVKGGCVTLFGEVNTFAAEIQAIEIIKNIKGVKNVVSNLDITSSHIYDDITIKNKVNSLLSSIEDHNLHDVTAEVNHGKVTLEGFVQKFSDMEIASELVAEVEGVTGIKNKLKLISKA